MWSKRYWSPRYWAARFWALGGGVAARRGLIFRFRSNSSAVAIETSEVAPMREWPEETLFAGSALVLRGTHDEDLAGQSISVWAYPDGDPGSAAQVGTGVITGARTFEAQVASATTAAWVGLRIVAEVWFEDSEDPIAWGAFYFTRSGRPTT